MTSSHSSHQPPMNRKDMPGEGTLAWWWIILRRVVESLDEVLAVLLGAIGVITLLGMLGLTYGSLINSG